jgi:hypothetical protein
LQVFGCGAQPDPLAVRRRYLIVAPGRCPRHRSLHAGTWP